VAELREPIDTGQIVNQGRAEHLFRGLTGTSGEPMTPREERGFGLVSLSTALHSRSCGEVTSSSL
jgi:hypothetical protein